MTRSSFKQPYYPAETTFTVYVDEAIGSDVTGDGTETNPFASFKHSWDYLINSSMRFDSINFRIIGDITIDNTVDYSFEGISARNCSIWFDNNVDVDFVNTSSWVFKEIDNLSRLSIFAFDNGLSGIPARINTGLNFSKCSEVSLTTLTISGDVFFREVNYVRMRSDPSSPLGIRTEIVDARIFLDNCGPDMELSPYLIGDSSVDMSGCFGKGFIQGDFRISGTSSVTDVPYFLLENCSHIRFTDDFLEIESTTLNRPLIHFRDCNNCTFAPDAVTNESGGPVVLGYPGTAYFVEIERSTVNWAPLSFATSMFDSSGNNNGLKIDASSIVTNTFRPGGDSVLALEFTVPQVNDIAPGTMIDEIPRYTSYVDDTAAGVGGLTTGQPYINTTIGALAIKI